MFSDETTLILHQKGKRFAMGHLRFGELRITSFDLLRHALAGKHWRCSECNKKLHSSSGMAIHMYQVHKIDVKT